jgi:hypothetical protein
MPVDDAYDIRLDRRRSRSGVSSGFVRLGNMIALSSAYGNPRCRPRIFNHKHLKGRTVYHQSDYNQFTQCLEL